MGERRRKISERRTAEGEESLMIALAMEQAKEQLLNHTAPSQIVTHFLKLGTRLAEIELEKTRSETQLAKAKAELMESQRKSEETAARALKAFKEYSGLRDEEDDEYYEEEYYDD